jgi:ferric iron reductase protein FhuF
MEQPMDLSLLKHFFHISLTGEEDAVTTIPGTDLLRREQMDAIISQSGTLLKATGTELAASFVGMAFFGVCASIQLILASHNRLLDLTLANMEFQIDMHEDHIHGCFKIRELRWKEAPEAAQDRDAWVAAELTSFYRNEIRPVVEIAAASAGVKPELIWSQYGARMAYALDYVEGIEKRPEVLERFRQDYQTLVRAVPAEVFGRRKNPFEHKPRYIDSPYVAGKKLMMRSSCCMYDRRENGEKCYNCPMLLPEEREARRLRIEAARDKQSEHTA